MAKFIRVTREQMEIGRAGMEQLEAQDPQAQEEKREMERMAEEEESRRDLARRSSGIIDPTYKPEASGIIDPQYKPEAKGMIDPQFKPEAKGVVEPQSIVDPVHDVGIVDPQTPAELMAEHRAKEADLRAEHRAKEAEARQQASRSRFPGEIS